MDDVFWNLGKNKNIDPYSGPNTITILEAIRQHEDRLHVDKAVLLIFTMDNHGNSVTGANKIVYDFGSSTFRVNTGAWQVSDAKRAVNRAIKQHLSRAVATLAVDDG